MSEDQLYAFYFPEEQEDVISFHSEEIDFELPRSPRIEDWIRAVIHNQNCRLVFLNIVFCSDEYLHQINFEYLDHDTFTDIITFPYADPPRIEGDVFISIDRVRENAVSFHVPLEQELHRVIIHGVLHLCGQGDKTPEEKVAMRDKEDEALELLGE